MSGGLAVGVLGPLRVSIDGRPVEISPPKLRALLVLLAVDAGSAVSLNRLATALWDGDPPEFLHRTLHTHLTRLRAALGAGWIVTEPAGYRLRTDPDQVDALRFTRLLDAAAQAPDVAVERAALTAALELWRGDPVDDLALARLDGLRARLVERYLAAVERLVDIELAAGRHADVVARLRDLTTSYPLREPLWERLLTALDRGGRQAEALASYEVVRRRLAEDLGADPGPELRSIYAGLLSEPSAPRQPARASATVGLVPRQLPPDIDGFTGRAMALKALHGLVGEAVGPGMGAVRIATIGGMAGVGKTALAVHWAHQVADRFPDGQLYVNLRGFHPSGQAMAPAEAIRGFLDALGVPAQRIPPDPDALVGMYRSLVSDRRMVVVLDNAHDPDQVRPLLPGSSTCVVLVTSRSRLTGLVATEAARPLLVELLPADEARELLAARLGEDRIAAEPAAVDAIVRRCAGLPLALAVSAARAATSGLPLATIAFQLDDEQSTLDTLDVGDPATDVRLVFSWSYRTLSPAAARLFRFLGLHPGQDLTAPAAASLAGIPAARARLALAELCGAHLLAEHTPGRYALHDLLRDYATELTHRHEDETERRAAIHRLLDHYLHTANTAGLLINPHRHQIAIAPARPDVTVEDLADDERAMAWFMTERRALLTAITHASVAGFDTHAWQLAWAVSDFLYRSGYWHDWRDANTTAVAAAQRGQGHRAEAIAHRGLAMACSNLGRHDEAQPHFHDALALYERLDDRTGQANTHLNLTALLSRRQRNTEALHHCRLALDLYTATGDRRGEAMALNTMGMLHAELGNYQEAVTHCRRAAAIFAEVSDRGNLASTWDSLGYIRHRQGRHDYAIRHYQRAAAVFHELGHRFFQAQTLSNLGDTYLAVGDRDAARTTWQQAGAIFDESAHPQADKTRAKLDAVW
jgi:DNA-binding SARP family transcriptional activator/tetratricopeptide (TPR) repeat protein